MFFLPIGCLIFVAFILFLPLLFILGYFQVITWGFENLGLSSTATLVIFSCILLGSAINIPIGRPKLFYVQKTRLFGLWKTPQIEAQGLAINLGGALVPICLSVYFIFTILRDEYSMQPILIATLVMMILARLISKVVPGVGIKIPVLFPPVFSAILAMILAPEYPAVCAFVSGTIGVLFGADLLNLPRIMKSGGFVSIGGAGVFDGIFLVGIASALLAGF
jgi:uncharacterized membrane protein